MRRVASSMARGGAVQMVSVAPKFEGFERELPLQEPGLGMRHRSFTVALTRPPYVNTELIKHPEASSDATWRVNQHRVSCPVRAAP